MAIKDALLLFLHKHKVVGACGLCRSLHKVTINHTDTVKQATLVFVFVEDLRGMWWHKEEVRQILKNGALNLEENTFDNEYLTANAVTPCLLGSLLLDDIC